MPEQTTGSGWRGQFSPGVLLHIVLTLVALGVIWGNTSAELNSAVKRIEALENQRLKDSELISELRNTLAMETQELIDFRQDYERDANRYIRDQKDQKQ